MEQARLQQKLMESATVEIDTPQLVARYNAALEYLGVPPTELARFSIDAMGWSCEIADEKGDPDYLCGGIAAPLAVLVTPEQTHARVLRPCYSFDRFILQRYFLENGRAVADITGEQWIVLEFDNERSVYQDIFDLLDILRVTVRTHAGALTEAAREQRDLVQRIHDEEFAWFDPRVRAALIESGRRHGDLRERAVLVPDMTFEDLQVFYARAFGGVYVLRRTNAAAPMLILEDKGRLSQAGGAPCQVVAVDDVKAVDRLFGEGFYELSAGEPGFLEWKRECLAADLLFADHPDLNYLALNDLQKKRMLAATRKALPLVFHELECIAQRGEAPDRKGISAPARRLLMQPARTLSEPVRAALWQLLGRIEPRDPVQLFFHHPSYFAQCWDEWPRARREWAAAAIMRAEGQQQEEAFFSAESKQHEEERG